LDTDNDGFITFQQYLNFIKKYLGNGIDLDSSRFKVKASSDVPTEELAFVNAIWDELKAYFDKYDAGAKGFLVETELKAFVVEVLQETTQRELDYVFWNLFRVDSNSNKEVDFLEFVLLLPFRPPSSSATPVRSPSNASTDSSRRERAI
jgi:Ca2+-binding EF-hand superfamily protein